MYLFHSVPATLFQQVTLLSQNGHSILVNPTNWSSGLDRNNHKQKPKEKKEKNRSEDQRNKVFTTWHYEYAMVDRVFLFLSPILFIIFNSIYWGYFLLWQWGWCGNPNEKEKMQTWWDPVMSCCCVSIDVVYYEFKQSSYCTEEYIDHIVLNGSKTDF